MPDPTAHPAAERVVRGLAAAGHGPSVVAIGFFDGVHRGHRSIVARAAARARDLDVRAVVVTFDRHPMEVVRPGSQPPLLMTLARRAQTLAGLDVDRVVVLPFDDELRHLAPDAFVDHVLVDPLQAAEVVVGENFTYGHRAAGDVAALVATGPAHGFRAEGVTLLEVDGEVVSSTRIRGHVERGEVAAAARLLGGPHVVDGVVVRGDQRGAGLGFPTANLRVDPRIAVPAPGVYAGRFTAGADAWDAVISVGTNPTFGGAELRVEAHLPGVTADLYGVEAAVDFRHHLREQRTYDRVDDLVVQMRLDTAEAVRLLATETAARSR